MKWRTQDGRLIDVGELPDEHLANILAMLERNTPGVLAAPSMDDYNLAAAAAGTMQGEMALLSMDQEMDRILAAMQPPIVTALLAEEGRRKEASP